MERLIQDIAELTNSCSTQAVDDTPRTSDGTASTRTAGCRDDDRSHLDRKAEDSDCSWTLEEDSGTFYIDFRRQLDSFLQASDRFTMTTNTLSRHQRRYVHATAQTMGLGHASLGAQGRFRQMIVFKNESTWSSALSQTISNESQNIDQPLLQFDEDNSLPIGNGPKKRKRVQRVDDGFVCQFERCGRVFDRVSERRKHEQAHQPAFTNRYQCPQCFKGFRYPKDVRRHQKIHDKGVALLDRLSTSLPTSTLASDSRVPSETSLTFSNNTLSYDNSPTLAPQNGIEGLSDDLEPIILNEEKSQHLAPFPEDDFDLAFQGLDGLNFDDLDGFDEGVLEMATFRK